MLAEATLRKSKHNANELDERRTLNKTIEACISIQLSLMNVTVFGLTWKICIAISACKTRTLLKPRALLCDNSQRAHHILLSSKNKEIPVLEDQCGMNVRRHHESSG